MLHDNDYLTEGLICPECNKKCIDYAFVGDIKTNRGYMSMWCNNCNKGIRMSRVIIPNNVKKFGFNDDEDIKNTIPNFEEIYPKD